MRIIIILYLICASTSIIRAQVHWLQVNASDTTSPLLTDLISGTSYLQYGDIQWVNYHPAISMSHPSEIDLNSDRLAQMSIYTVYVPQPKSTEELIWRIGKKEADDLILTTDRIADLSEGRFMNFVDRHSDRPQINAYHQFKNAFVVDRLRLGDLPSHQDIPVRSFTGAIAEMIIFDRRLSPISHQIVQSHLALKYGIPLSEGVDYLDASGFTIWSKQVHSPYNHGISAIGRQDDLRLYQKQSKTPLGSGSLSMGLQEITSTHNLNTAELSNNEYILWAHDDRPVSFSRIDTDVWYLDRKWKLADLRTTTHTPLAMIIDHHGIRASMTDHSQLYIAVTNAPYDDVDLAHCHIYPTTYESGSLGAQNINLYPTSYLQMIKAPPLWIMIDVDDSDCTDHDNGTIHFLPVGGAPPYHVTLSQLDGSCTKQKTMQTPDAGAMDELPQGVYRIMIRDANDQTWSTECHVNAKNLPSIDLPSSIILDPDEEQLLDATIDGHHPLDYRWEDPHGHMIHTPITPITTAGRYRLHVAIEDCHAWYDVEVIAHLDLISSMKLSPNPSTDGYFSLQAELKEAAPYTVTLWTESGHILSTKSFEKGQFINYQGYTDHTGILFVTLTSSGHTRTEKLIIRR